MGVTRGRESVDYRRDGRSLQADLVRRGCGVPVAGGVASGNPGLATPAQCAAASIAKASETQQRRPADVHGALSPGSQRARGPCRDRSIPNAHGSNPSNEGCPVCSVSITNEVLRRFAPATGFGQLPRNPFRVRMCPLILMGSAQSHISRCIRLPCIDWEQSRAPVNGATAQPLRVSYRRKPTPIGLGSFGGTNAYKRLPNERGWDRKTSLDRSRLQGLHRA
jgi:hypothetical protein